MYDHETGTFSEGNIPREHRDTYLREAGYGNVRQLTGWEKDLVEEDFKKIIKEHEPDLEQ